MCPNILSRLDNHVLKAKILNDKNIGEEVLIQRMSNTPTNLKFFIK